MPMYTYHCDECSMAREVIVSYAQRDAQECECGKPLRRAGVEAFRTNPSAWQMHAVLKDGRRIKGHFGKAAMLNKPGRPR